MNRGQLDWSQEAKYRRDYFTACKKDLEALTKHLNHLHRRTQEYAKMVKGSPGSQPLVQQVEALANRYRKLIEQARPVVQATHSLANWRFTPPPGSSNNGPSTANFIGSSGTTLPSFGATTTGPSSPGIGLKSTNLGSSLSGDNNRG